MASSLTLHDPKEGSFDIIGLDEFGPEFGALHMKGGVGDFSITIILHSTPQDLIFLARLRHAVDEAMKWAINK